MNNSLRFLSIIGFVFIIAGGVFFLVRGIPEVVPSPVPIPNPASVPAPTPVPPSTSIQGPIGFVGCSNSRDTVQGYRAVGGTRIWNPLSDTTYGGGRPTIWAAEIGNPNSKYWKEFDAMLAKAPRTNTLWLSLCLRTEDADAASYTATLSVIAELKRKIPGVVIYVSAINGFVAPHLCQPMGIDGPARAQVLADRLVSEGRAKAGPDVGDLISGAPPASEGATPANNETLSDGCHPNPQRGEPKLGRELLKFFPNPTSSPNPPPPPAPVSNPVGFVGCSNIRDAVQGYRAVGGVRIWKPTTNTTYGGGTPVAWSNAISDPNAKYWKEFDVMNAANPGAKTVWFGLCLRAVESDLASYNGAVATIDEIKRKIPGVTVYVSAINGFVEPHACSITGKNGPARAQVLADRLVSEGRAKAGPDVGDLLSDDQIPSEGATAANTETVADGCHPNPERGEPKLGRELLKFFPN